MKKENPKESNSINTSEKRTQAYIKQVRDEANEDMKRHTSSLKEDFQDKLKFVTEQVLSTKDAVYEMKEDIDSMKSSIEKINIKLDYKADQSYAVSLDKRIITLETGKK